MESLLEKTSIGYRLKNSKITKVTTDYYVSLTLSGQLQTVVILNSVIIDY